MVHWLVRLTFRGPGFDSAPRAVILTEGFYGFPQSLQANSGIVPQIMPRPLPSTLFTKYYLLIILPLCSLNYSSGKETISTWSRVLETPPVAQPLKKFPEGYGTRSFATRFTRAHHWSLSRVR
jgi:hypothetical protein